MRTKTTVAPRTLGRIRLRVAIFNTYRGRGVHQGGLEKLIAQDRPDVILLQEADPSCHDEIKALTGDTYWFVPGPVLVRSLESGQLPILLRKSRFSILDVSNELITERLSSFHPARHLTKVKVFDKRTGRIYVIVNVHTWAGVNRGYKPCGPGHIRESHLAQIDAVGAASQRMKETRLFLAGGDWNQDHKRPWLKPWAKYNVAVRMAKHGLIGGAAALGEKPFSTSLEADRALDELYFRAAEFVHPYRRYRRQLAGADHFAVITDLLIDPHPARRRR